MSLRSIEISRIKPQKLSTKVALGVLAVLTSKKALETSGVMPDINNEHLQRYVEYFNKRKAALYAYIYPPEESLPSIRERLENTVGEERERLQIKLSDLSDRIRTNLGEAALSTVTHVQGFNVGVVLNKPRGKVARIFNGLASKIHARPDSLEISGEVYFKEGEEGLQDAEVVIDEASTTSTRVIRRFRGLADTINHSE